jgi:hypothetical protein
MASRRSKRMGRHRNVIEPVSPPTIPPLVKEIIRLFARASKEKPRHLISKGGDRALRYARHETIHALCYVKNWDGENRYTLNQIAKWFGIHHTSVLFSRRKIDRVIKENLHDLIISRDPNPDPDTQAAELAALVAPPTPSDNLLDKEGGAD